MSDDSRQRVLLRGRQRIAGVVADGDNVYGFVLANEETRAGCLVCVNREGGAVRELLADCAPTALAEAGPYLYVSDAGAFAHGGAAGSIIRIGKIGGSRSVIVPNVPFPPPTRLLLGPGALFWNSGTSIFRIALDGVVAPQLAWRGALAGPFSVDHDGGLCVAEAYTRRILWQGRSDVSPVSEYVHDALITSLAADSDQIAFADERGRLFMVAWHSPSHVRFLAQLEGQVHHILVRGLSVYLSVPAISAVVRADWLTGVITHVMDGLGHPAGLACDDCTLYCADFVGGTIVARELEAT